jgi:tRNA-modifying protein YgfZ
MFSAEQYRALHEGAGLVTRVERGQLVFTGADRRAFLQGLLTNDVQALEPGSGCYAALLTPHGRMIADLRVFELGDRTVADVDASQAEALRDRFDQVIFSEDAHVEDVSASTRELGVYGPLAAGTIAAMITTAAPAIGDTSALEAMPLYFNRRFETANGPVIVVRSDELGVEGFDLLVDASRADSIAAGLRASGAVDIDADTAEVTRIERGRPRFGVDMDEETIPLEAGIEDRAISLSKGCYVGQEIIIRVLHRGHGRVAKRLVGLTFDPSGAVPVRGDVIRAGDRQIGVVTSATHSPALGRPVAMAYVHRDFTEPLTAVSVVTGRSPQPAIVARLPLVGTPLVGRGL